MTQILLQADTLGGQKEELVTSLLGLLVKGGVIMIPIGILLVIALFIFFERWFTIRRAGRIDSRFMNNIRDHVTTGNIEAAKALCRNEDTPISRMVEKGLTRLGRPLRDISAAIENVGKLHLYKLEKSLALLATTAGAAPMLGFLGTVIGMIGAFKNLHDSGGQAGYELLAGDIYVALVTTAAGLVVGILAFLGYNTLVAQVEKVVYKMEAASVEFVDVLQEPA